MSEQAGQRRRPKRGEAGLVTLEWLLIVGAVAGLAALAVVLVYAFVEDTGDRFAAPIPLMTAAEVQAAEVVNEAKSASKDDFDTWDDWERYFRGKCARIEITAGDDRIKVASKVFNGPVDSQGDPVEEFRETAALAAHTSGPTATNAQVDCAVGQV